MITREEAVSKIGQEVDYLPPHGARQSGVITSVGSLYVFVRYHGDWSSKATAPECLSWPSDRKESPDE